MTIDTITVRRLLRRRRSRIASRSRNDANAVR